MALISRRKFEGIIQPDTFYSYHLGPYFFGYELTQMSERIKSGDLPWPTSASDDGRRKGWYGRVILAHQAKREEKSRQQEQLAREKLAREAEKERTHSRKKRSAQ